MQNGGKYVQKKTQKRKASGKCVSVSAGVPSGVEVTVGVGDSSDAITFSESEAAGTPDSFEEIFSSGEEDSCITDTENTLPAASDSECRTLLPVRELFQ